MSVSARTIVRSDVAPSTIFLGLDVHKESVTIAVLPSDAAVPTHVDKLATTSSSSAAISSGSALRQHCGRAMKGPAPATCSSASSPPEDRLHGDRAVVDPDQTRRAAEA